MENPTMESCKNLQSRAIRWLHTVLAQSSHMGHPSLSYVLCWATVQWFSGQNLSKDLYQASIALSSVISVEAAVPLYDSGAALARSIKQTDPSALRVMFDFEMSPCRTFPAWNVVRAETADCVRFGLMLFREVSAWPQSSIAIQCSSPSKHAPTAWSFGIVVPCIIVEFSSWLLYCEFVWLWIYWRHDALSFTRLIARLLSRSLAEEPVAAYARAKSDDCLRKFEVDWGSLP